MNQNKDFVRSQILGNWCSMCNWIGLALWRGIFYYALCVASDISIQYWNVELLDLKYRYAYLLKRFFIRLVIMDATTVKDPIPSDRVPRPPLGYSTHSVSSLSFRPLLAQKDPLAHHQPRTFWRTQKTTGQRLRRRLFLVGLPKAAQQCSVVVELFGSTRSRDRLFIDGFCWWSTRGSSIGD